jgi:cell division protein FtsZ
MVSKKKKILKKKKALSARKKVLIKKKKKPVKKLVIKTKSKKVIKKFIVKKVSARKKVIPAKARKIKKKIKKVMRPKKSRSPKDFPAESFFKAKIKVIGIGGGGGSIVSEIGRSLHKATFVVADTDMRAFKKKPGIKNFLFGQKLTHGLGTGVNPELGRNAADQERERIARLFDDQDIVIFIASLGGGLGSGATQVFAEAAKDFNGITFGIFTLPFKFEGKNKYKIAIKSLRHLRRSLNVSVTIPNEKIFKIINANTAITDAFSIVNESLIESLESLIDLIYSPGIINIDFADLRAILKGKGNLAFLNTQEASGKDRAQQISQKILQNPLYQSNNFTTEKILFNITGGPNLSMFEVDSISKSIAQLNPKAKIIFGISKNPKFKNKVKTTLLMTGPSMVMEEIPIKEPVAPKEPSTVKVSDAVKVIPEKPQRQEKKVAEKTKPVKKKSSKKQKKPTVKAAPEKPTEPEKIPFDEALSPVFNIAPVDATPRKLSIIEESEHKTLVYGRPPAKVGKTIRRTALEIKKAQEADEQKQSAQEKEWEIPAFLRKVKFK